MTDRINACAACGGRGWIARRTGYLKTVTGRRYRGGIARDYCFDCRGTGYTAPPREGDGQ